jgi:hypothetical protein
MEYEMKSYFRILKLSPPADIKQLKLAYKIRAKELHPDLNHNRDTTQSFQQLNEAYAILQKYFEDIETDSIKEVYFSQDKALSSFALTSDLLHEGKHHYTVDEFFNILSELGLARKSMECNDNHWVIKGEALKYGMNFTDKSKELPMQTLFNASVQKYFDKYDGLFKVTIQIDSSYRSSVLWQKKSFSTFLTIVKSHKKAKSKHKRSRKRSDDTLWPYEVVCRGCGSDNINKQEKWERQTYQILSCVCNACNLSFQELMEYEKVSELDRDISELEPIEEVSREAEPSETSTTWMERLIVSVKKILFIK